MTLDYTIQVFYIIALVIAISTDFYRPNFNKQIEQNYILQQIYYHPRGYYRTPEKLWAKVQAEGHDFGISDITEWLHKQAIWQIHSPVPKYVPQVSFNKITRPNMYHQADILYMPYDTVDRKLYKYCLNIVDVASRYKASVPLEDRSSARVAKAFKKIYSKADCPLIWPRVLQVDGGSEFKDEVIRLMDEKGVRIRDAKELLTEGMSPVEAIQKDQVYALPSKIRKDRPVDYRGRRRATDPIWSTKVYTIESSTVVDGQPVIYRLSDGPKKIFTREELLVVPSDTMLPPTHILY
ncbi:unnamed protein product [Rhizophagus irregularis]|nr:unnamed protein product [Rhizophagus irregularis]